MTHRSTSQATSNTLFALLAGLGAVATPLAAYACPGSYTGLSCGGYCTSTGCNFGAYTDVQMWAVDGSACPAGNVCAWGTLDASTGTAVDFCCALTATGASFTITGTPGDDAISLQFSTHDLDAYTTASFTGQVYGGGGVDTITGSRSLNNYYHDVLEGQDGDDVITADAGTDTCIGGLGDDDIDGGTGSDTIRGNGGSDTVVGGSGQDMISGGAGADSLTGDGDGDVICGDDANDTLNGNPGNNTLWGGAGTNALDGGIDVDFCDGTAPPDVNCENFFTTRPSNCPAP